jgi:hypothetical protein
VTIFSSASCLLTFVRVPVCSLSVSKLRRNKLCLREFYFSEIKGPALFLTRTYFSVKAMLASKNGAGPLIS